jgi:hypothetical protein
MGYSGLKANLGSRTNGQKKRVVAKKAPDHSSGAPHAIGSKDTSGCKFGARITF